MLRYYIKNTTNPNRLNINLDKLEEMASKYGLTKKTLHIDLIQEIEKLNNFYSTVSDAQWLKWNVANLEYLDIDNPFYLGLYREYEWMIHLLTHVEQKKDYHTFEHRSVKNTVAITRPLRELLWKDYFANNDGVCYCCSQKITILNFHAGHIIPRVRGGETNRSNLRPVCSSCNLDMKIEHIKEYKQKLLKQLE